MKIRAKHFRCWLAILMPLLSGLAATDARAQLAASTYQFSAVGGSFTEITGGTAITGVSVDNGISPALPIGFTFNYCGTNYTQLKVCSNGWITFNTGVTSTTSTNDATNIGNIKPALMPLFDNLAGWGTGAAPAYVTTGAAPNRIFTLELKNWNWRMSNGSAPNLSIQVKLYESGNLIEYIYRQETAAGDPGSYGATIGIADNSTPAGYLVLDNATATPAASSATLTTNITTRPATGQIYRFKPIVPIDMDADSIVVATPFCGNATQPVSVRIKNKGTATVNSVSLRWSVNGVTQVPVTHSVPVGSISTAPANTATVLLGNVYFPDNNPITIKAWTYQPNGLADEVPANDTVTQAITPSLAGVTVKISPRDTTICQGSNITLDAGSFPNNPIYVWSNGSLAQTINVTLPGLYSVKVQNSMGCVDRDTVTVSVYPNPVVNSIAVVDNGGNAYTLTAVGAQHVSNWTWNFGDGTAPLSGTGLPGPQTHTYTSAGEYTVTLTLSNDCKEISITKVIKVNAVTGIDAIAQLQQALTLYPNPAAKVVTLSTGHHPVVIKSVSVYNIIGQQVYQAPVSNNQHQIDIASLPAGIYTMMIATEKGNVAKKLEVIR